MRSLVITLVLLIIGIFSASAVKKFEPNPINVAAVIVEKIDSVQVASTCEYYGFKYDGVVDGYTVMKRQNGAEIKFTFQENGISQKYPTIIVKTTGTRKEIEERLNEVNFEKEGNKYTAPHNQYSRYIKQCSLGPHNTLKFRKLYNQSHK